MKGRAGVQNGDQPSVKRAWKVCVYWGEGRGGQRGAENTAEHVNWKIVTPPPPTMTEFLT